MNRKEYTERSNSRYAIDSDNNGSLIKATIAAIVTATIGALLWITISYIFRWQINYMAIAVGALVGTFVSKYNQSASLAAGVIAAITAALACVIGDFIITMQDISEHLEMSYSQIFEQYNTRDIMKAHLNSLDLYSCFFYGLALVIAFILGKSDYKELLKKEPTAEESESNEAK